MTKSHPEYQNLCQSRLLETLVTSRDSLGTTNIAAMGPRVSDDFQWLLLRPFRGSATLDNLMADPHGVMHICDDVELLVQAALDIWPTGLPAFIPVADAGCARLRDCCRWYAFVVEEVDTSQSRSELVCRVADCGRVRDFVGWNRAQHAVIEAAIIASRLHMLERVDVEQSLSQLSTVVEKTAGPNERAAFALVQRWIAAKGVGA